METHPSLTSRLKGMIRYYAKREFGVELPERTIESMLGRSGAELDRRRYKGVSLGAVKRVADRVFYASTRKLHALPATEIVEPAPAKGKYQVLGAGVIATSSRDGSVQRRPFVAVRVAPKKVRAFYQSTGTGGETERGEWVLFGGLAADSWFIKAAGGKRVPKYAAVVEWLKDRYGTEAEDTSDRILAEGGRLFDATERTESRSELARLQVEVNTFLSGLGAIAESRPGYTEDLDAQRKHAVTLVAAPRREFGSGGQVKVGDVVFGGRGKKKRVGKVRSFYELKGQKRAWVYYPYEHADLRGYEQNAALDELKPATAEQQAEFVQRERAMRGTGRAVATA